MGGAGGGPTSTSSSGSTPTSTSSSGSTPTSTSSSGSTPTSTSSSVSTTSPSSSSGTPCSSGGFSATSSDFPIPTLSQPLDALSGESNFCGSGYQFWSTVDIDGDGKLDLVQTSSCADTSVGVTHWEVYKGTGSGFAASASSFAIPTLSQPLDALSGESNFCGSGYQFWSTVDIDGDGKLDLVQTSSCADTSVGVTHWEVYKGTRFGLRRERLVVRDPVALSQPLDALSGESNFCGSGYQFWSTVDIDGDGKLDLVQTSSCADTTVGVTHWEVYQGTGSGFAASASSFAIPTLSEPLDALSGESNFCGSGYQFWSTVDIDGDGKLDLVQTSSCAETTVGVSLWEVYKGTGSALAACASSFAIQNVVAAARRALGGEQLLRQRLPVLVDGRHRRGWQARPRADLELRGHQRRRHALGGLPGHRLRLRRERLVVRDPDVVAASRRALGESNFCGSGYQFWSTVDVDGDGKRDLVLTSSCSDTTVGVSRWLVFKGTCSP